MLSQLAQSCSLVIWFAAEAPGDDDVEEDDLAEEDDEEDYEEEKPPAKKAKAAAKPTAKGAAGKAAGGKKGGQAAKGVTHTCPDCRLFYLYPPASPFFAILKSRWLRSAHSFCRSLQQRGLAVD